MPSPPDQFPRALAEASRTTRIGDIPALLAHPDWTTRRPVVIWMHGRTVSKELDPGRYLRWIRAGIAACAIDLPGHGERLDASFHSPARTMDLIEQAVREVDQVVAALSASQYSDLFDADRIAIGGMSAGGMVTLARLCSPHRFVCAAVEATTGWLSGLYFPDLHALPTRDTELPRHDTARVNALDPLQHLESWRPIPLLALHTEADRVVPFPGMRAFVERLRQHYLHRGTDPDLVRLVTWQETGAPQEHAGFGRFGNDAKNTQVEFLSRWLGV